MPIETAKRVIEEAVKSKLKDSVIIQQQHRIVNDSLYYTKMESNFKDQIEALKGITLNQTEISRHQNQLIDLKNKELRKYRRERKIGGIAIIGLIILAVL